MVKKVLFVLIGIVILSFLFVYFKGQKINTVTNLNNDNITKIIFYDGSGKNKPIALEDNQKIKEFMRYLDGYVLRRTIITSISTGWIHSAVFYENDKAVMNVTFVSPIIINGKYYKVIREGLTTNKIEEFLKSINPAYNRS